MVLKVCGENDSHILYGRKMTETELKGQIQFIEEISDPSKNDFAETLARIFDWNIVPEWEYIDYIYDRVNRSLIPSLSPQEQEENRE